MVTGIIYVITNDKNSKVYVGQTTQNIADRFKQHIDIALGNRSNTKFAKAIREIGSEHFKIVEIGRFQLAELNQKEIEYIAKYNSYLDGYNSTPGGHWNSRFISDEMKRSIRTDYIDGYTEAELCIKYKISVTSLLKYTKSIEKVKTNSKYGSSCSLGDKDVIIIMYDKYFNIERKFSDIHSAAHFMGVSGDAASMFKWKVGIACYVGNIVSGHRWQREDELAYKGLRFRSYMDKEEYIRTGGIGYLVNNGVIEYNSISARLGINKQRILCKSCRKEIKSGNFCEACRLKIQRDRDDKINTKISELLAGGYNYTEIGQAIGMSANGVKKRALKLGLIAGSAYNKRVIMISDTGEVEFKTFSDAVRFLCDLGVLTPGDIYSKAYKIKKAAESNRKYLGFEWKILDSTNKYNKLS